MCYTQMNLGFFQNVDETGRIYFMSIIFLMVLKFPVSKR